jgi:uncharacterized spore protein YtfJ
MGEVMKPPEDALDRASELIRRAGDAMHGSRSFGPVVEAEGCTVIPVAYVIGGGGGGGKESPTPESGGGFGFVSWPVGAYVIKNGDVRWRPTIDAGALALLGIGLLRTMMRRRRRR